MAKYAFFFEKATQMILQKVAKKIAKRNAKKIGAELFFHKQGAFPIKKKQLEGANGDGPVVMVKTLAIEPS